MAADPTVPPDASQEPALAPETISGAQDEPRDALGRRSRGTRLDQLTRRVANLNEEEEKIERRIRTLEEDEQAAVRAAISHAPISASPHALSGRADKALKERESLERRLRHLRMDRAETIELAAEEEAAWCAERLREAHQEAARHRADEETAWQEMASHLAAYSGSYAKAVGAAEAADAVFSSVVHGDDRLALTETELRALEAACQPSIIPFPIDVEAAMSMIVRAVFDPGGIGYRDGAVRLDARNRLIALVDDLRHLNVRPNLSGRVDTTGTAPNDQPHRPGLNFGMLDS